MNQVKEDQHVGSKKLKKLYYKIKETEQLRQNFLYQKEIKKQFKLPWTTVQETTEKENG